MRNSKALFQDFVNQLHLPESPEEIQSVAFLALENLLGLSRTEIMADKAVANPPLEKLREVIQRLNAHEPIQYILGEAYFFGRKFYVNSSVLIPRPETEELVQHVIHFSNQFSKTKRLKILDVGTGSGCIPVTLACEIAGTEIYATDISSDALEVAKKNASRFGANVFLIHHNILTQKFPIYDFDVVVSNPPYISKTEMTSMKSNVVDFEPHLALFVEEDDPLLFYKAISRRAKEIMSPSGMLCTEINERFGDEVVDIFKQSGFDRVEIVRDLQGKNRIVKGILT